MTVGYAYVTDNRYTHLVGHRGLSGVMRLGHVIVKVICFPRLTTPDRLWVVGLADPIEIQTYASSTLSLEMLSSPRLAALVASVSQTNFVRARPDAFLALLPSYEKTYSTLVVLVLPIQVQKYYGRHEVHASVANTMAEAEYVKGSTYDLYHVCQLERKVSYTTCNLGSDYVPPVDGGKAATRPGCHRATCKADNDACSSIHAVSVLPPYHNNAVLASDGGSGTTKRRLDAALAELQSVWRMSTAKRRTAPYFQRLCCETMVAHIVFFFFFFAVVLQVRTEDGA